MKKLFLGMTTVCLFSLNSFANNTDLLPGKSVASTPKVITETPTEAKKPATPCRITCSVSVTVNGVTHTYSTSAGSIFTSCEVAADKCDLKLAQIMNDER